jgi:hypothetical protein
MRGAVQMASAKTGGRDDFNTPPPALEAVRRYAPIDLDPCWNPSSMTEPFLGKFDGGQLGCGIDAWWPTHIRDGIAFVNWPYSASAAWSEKLVQQAGERVPIIALVACRTDTRWWRRIWPYVDAEARWHGRLRFWLDGKPAASGATFASSFLGINVSQRRFRAAFEGVATVVVP